MARHDDVETMTVLIGRSDKPRALNGTFGGDDGGKINQVVVCNTGIEERLVKGGQRRRPLARTTSDDNVHISSGGRAYKQSLLSENNQVVERKEVMKNF